jgi:hypothetical protein
MSNVTLDDESALLLQISDDLAVGLLDVDTLVFWDFGSESTGFVNRARRDLVLGDDLMSETNSVIVLSPSWSLVNDTSTSLFGDIIVRQDSESSVLVLHVSLTPTYGVVQLTCSVK